MQPLIIGIDWAGETHVVVIWQDGQEGAPTPLENTEVAIYSWLASLRTQGRRLAIACEQGGGLLANILLAQPDVDYYRINPSVLDQYRKSWRISNAKDDNHDAGCLARLLAERLAKLKPVTPPAQILGSLTLTLLCRARRDLVSEKVAVGQRLEAQLNSTYPQALRIADVPIDAPLMRQFLIAYPNWSALRKTRRDTLEKRLRQWQARQLDARLDAWDLACSVDFPVDLDEVHAGITASLLVVLTTLIEQIHQLEIQIAKAMADHPDAAKAKSLPGAGNALAPRVTAVMSACPAGADISVTTGVCPIVRSSGRSYQVQRRVAKPIFEHQTLTEFADASRKTCLWAAAFYQYQSQRNPGQTHHSKIRKLAVIWSRILHAMWQHNRLYDEHLYLLGLKRQGSPLVAFMRTIGTWPEALDRLSTTPENQPQNLSTTP